MRGVYLTKSNTLNAEAEALNNTIKSSSHTVLEILSARGKAIYFPKKGILSQSAEAKGKRINATIGIALEDDSTPMRLNAIAGQISLTPDAVFPYAPSPGIPKIREKWKQMIFEKNPSLTNKTMSLPIVTSGLTHGLSIAGYLFVDPKDKIIIPDLYWENYDLVFGNAYGARFVPFKFFRSGRFNIEGLKNRLSGKAGKKILLLNFPNNPSGYTPTIEEADQIVEAIRVCASEGSRIVVILDDAYFGLVYQDGICKESLFAALSNIHENVFAIKIDGPIKEDYTWGLRVGFLSFAIKNGTKELYDALESKAGGAIRGNISNCSNLSQSLLLKAFEDPGYKDEKKVKNDILKKRYLAIRAALTDRKYSRHFRALPFNSGYFMCVEIKDVEAEKVRQQLIQKYDVGVICFGQLIRIAYSAVLEKDIKAIFEAIYSACEELGRK
jgi:aspartate/methionine/tyrosine aminotransferase